MKSKLLCIALLVSLHVFAQKKRIAITSFQNPSKTSNKYVEAIEDKVEAAFTANNRFEIIERIDLKAINVEANEQKNEIYMDGLTVAQGRRNGAEAIVVGTLNNVDFEKNTTNTGTVYYDCSISLSLKILSVETGESLANELIMLKMKLWDVFGDKGTPDQSFFTTLKKADKAIDKFLAKHFPVTTLIIEISNASSNKAKSILVNTGALNGTKKNQKFKVVEITTKKVGSKEITRRKEIGQIKITKVEGDEISEAKVLKGGAIIFSKFNAGAKLECESIN